MTQKAFSFIGAIHRLAAFMDNQIDLVCGCFSVNPEISKSSGKAYFLPGIVGGQPPPR